MKTAIKFRPIQTARLVLRAHEVSGFPSLRAMWADPQVVRHIYVRPQTDAESQFRLFRYRGHWSLLGYGYWAVIDREDGKYLGEMGFADYRREIEPSFDGMPEAGWVMTSQSHGRGLAAEAMKAALEWSDINLDAARTVAMVSADNAKSARLAEALGYERKRSSVYCGKKQLIFERTRRMKDQKA